jgi:hypothetical protein
MCYMFVLFVFKIGDIPELHLWNILSFKRFSRIRATQLDQLIYVGLSRHIYSVSRYGKEGNDCGVCWQKAIILIS